MERAARARPRGRAARARVDGAPRAGHAVPIPGELHHELRTALERVGIVALHTHQEDALLAAFDGPTIVTTGTASGKSLCFQLPTLQSS